MKKIVALVLALAMVCSLTACGKGGSNGKVALKMWCIATESDLNRYACSTVVVR